MRKKLSNVLLIEDNEPDRYYHEIILRQLDITEGIDFAEDGIQALEYFKNGNQRPPALVFLDINMPRMNGWEFLEEYKELDITKKARVIIVMLTSSFNPADIERAAKIPDVTDYKVKPLTEEIVFEILEKHFSG